MDKFLREHRPSPPHWKTDHLARLSELDDEAVRQAADDIVSGFLADAKTLDEMMEAAKEKGVSWDELRIVPENMVKRYYGQFTPAGGATKLGKAYDAAVDFTAMSIVFARVGYIPKNILQNLIMSVPHQGPFLLANVPRAMQVLRDPELLHRIAAEVGHGATMGLAEEARFAKTFRGLPSKSAALVGNIADDPMRISAFLHEAAAAGVISKYRAALTPEDRVKLLELFTDPAQEAKLNDIRERAVGVMGDFSRLTPYQRRWARRFLIIPSARRWQPHQGRYGHDK